MLVSWVGNQVQLRIVTCPKSALPPSPVQSGLVFSGTPLTVLLLLLLACAATCSGWRRAATRCRRGALEVKAACCTEQEAAAWAAMAASSGGGALGSRAGVGGCCGCALARPSRGC